MTISFVVRTLLLLDSSSVFQSNISLLPPVNAYVCLLVVTQLFLICVVCVSGIYLSFIFDFAMRQFNNRSQVVSNVCNNNKWLMGRRQVYHSLICSSLTIFPVKKVTFRLHVFFYFHLLFETFSKALNCSMHIVALTFFKIVVGAQVQFFTPSERVTSLTRDSLTSIIRLLVRVHSNCKEKVIDCSVTWY